MKNILRLILFNTFLSGIVSSNLWAQVASGTWMLSTDKTSSIAYGTLNANFDLPIRKKQE